MAEQPDSSHSLDLEVLGYYHGVEGELEARGVESVLRAAGIEAIVEGAVGFPSVPFEVSVPRNQLEEARRVLAEALAAGPAAAEDAEVAFEESGQQIPPAE